MVSLDLARLRSVDLDRTSLTARLGPGLTGPDAETALGSLGVTLGHFPQSFEEATIGGFAATRSAGQASSGYGRFDGLVTAIELCAPAGRLRTLQVPHTAAGPSSASWSWGPRNPGRDHGGDLPGSAGARPPALRGLDRGGLRAGAGDRSRLAQRDEAPDVLRLSDEEETRVSLELAGAEGFRRRALETSRFGAAVAAA